MKKIAIYAITKNGSKLAHWIKRELPFADSFVTHALEDEANGSQALVLPLSEFLSDRFSKYDAHILICATGIVSRMIAPLVNDKRTDPAVVCVDEQGLFAVSMLSGHRGGANELTTRVAHIVKGTPVVTTASDIVETVSADMLGARFGWILDPISESAITAVSASIVNEEPVLIAQQAGEKDWWQYNKRMPAHIHCHDRLEGMDSTDYRGAILVSDERHVDLTSWNQNVVLWRPKSLVLGIGCDRGTPLSVLISGLEAFSQKFNLSLNCIREVASIDLKADELGLNQLSEAYQWPFKSFSPDELDNLIGIENPSEYVKSVTGSNSVSEAAALKASGTNRLLVAKWAFKKEGFNMTIACCRMTYSESLIKQNRKNWLEDKDRHGSEHIKTNLHGNPVVKGYQCKPKHVDLERPMLFHTHHLLLCEGARCAKHGSKNLAHELRSILKRLGFASGQQRIKISRTLCAGACRNRATMAIYQRAKKSESVALTNHGIWLRGVEEFSDTCWSMLFTALAKNQPISEILEPRFFAPFEETEV
ncbi:cobalamin biosynthesis protein [Vibrio sp. 10N.222.51.C12]|uniref:cobalamin biosynthesis protein n=1 Tax=unclassified Vibrio TaxID=2614977 RepID=UPI000C8175C3|nr:cobalamin biosynthesis protein [Vibrio sp. 10N.286.48.B7]PMH77721.1 cobalamin biosynthesis protein [Vibrio sp. 10N.286.48.B7]